jgi:hypothetical protein
MPHVHACGVGSPLSGDAGVQSYGSIPQATVRHAEVEQNAIIHYRSKEFDK